MMGKNFSNIQAHVYKADSQRVAYIILPGVETHSWMQHQARTLNVNIVGITGMDWDNDLTPWPAPGQPPGAPAFLGEAPQFLEYLTARLIPRVEKQLGLIAPERTLIGISLSGLFAVWAWMNGSEFENIASISGSMWYEGFVAWLQGKPCPPKKGRIYFSLGEQEPLTSVAAFRPVGRDTAAVVGYFKSHGVATCFQWNPGNHYAPLKPRLTKAFVWLYGK